MKKIIFVNLSRTVQRFPLGLAYLISTVREKTDHEPILFDEGYYADKLGRSSSECLELFRELFLKTKPDYVGFTLYQQHIEQFLGYAKLIRSSGARCKIIVGGPHPTVFKEQMTRNLAEIDILVIGEGEKILSQILNSEDLNSIPNIVFRKDGKVIATERKPNYNFRIDELPWPARDAFDMKMYAQAYPVRTRPTAVMLFSRGCSGSCSFCISRQIYGAYRSRDPHDAIREIKALLKKHPFIENIYFTDNCFNLKDANTLRFLELFYSEGLHRRISIAVQTRLDLVDKETVRLLKDSNCCFVGIGIESFSKHIQRRMGKTFSYAEFEKKDALLKKAGLFTPYYMMMNYPGMSFEDVMFNFRKIRELKLPFVLIMQFTPVPGTKAFDELARAHEIPILSDPALDWHSNFIQSQYTSKDYLRLTSPQMKEYERQKSALSRRNAFNYFASLGLRQKVSFFIQRVIQNPVQASRFVIDNFAFWR
ncbi:MAG: radical SAM protein [archaeon]